MDQTSIATLENENVSFTIEKQPRCRIVFHATVKKPLLNKARKEALRRTAKQIDIPGFRKGTASEQMVMQRAPELFRKTLEESITSFAYQECQRMHFIPPVREEPKVAYRCQKLEEAEALFDIIFETRPDIPLITIDKLTLPSAAKNNPEAIDMAKELREVGEWFTTYLPVEGRAASRGDFATLTIVDLETDERKVIFDKERFPLEEGKVGLWLIDAVCGMEIGSSKETCSLPDPNAPDSSLFGEKKVLITLESLSSKEYPSEEKLVQLLGAGSVENLHEKLSLLRDRRIAFEAGQKNRQDLVAQILEQFPFDVPHSMIEQEVKVRLDELLSHETTRKALIAKTDEEKKAFIAQMEKEAHEAIALHCICLRYKEANQLELSEDSLQSYHPVMAMMDVFYPEKKKENSDLNKEFSRHLIATVCDDIMSKLLMTSNQTEIS